MKTGMLEWGVAAAPLPGETECGDLHVVQAFTGGVLVAVIDAIGHGAEAARIAGLAAGLLERHPAKPVRALMQKCHERLRGSRGAAISIASFDDRACSMAWLGVGNVGGVLLRADAAAQGRWDSLLVRGGMVGDHLPELQSSAIPVERGDTLIMATDGIASDFREALPGELESQELAEQIERDYATTTDDSLVLVARYTGAC
ncbi:MAG: SpoIIE family protein phosphatase [Burkholderiales bacterium]